MPRKTLRRWIPHLREVLRDRSLRAVFGEMLNHPNLWHLNRYSVSWAVTVGLFMAFVPFTSQMVLAAAVAILIRCNLPIAVALVWISNPITMAPLFFAAYKFGAWMLNVTPQAVQFEMSFAWLVNKLGAIWEPFILGCLVLAIVTGLVGHLTVRIIWRIHVITSWHERRQRRERYHPPVTREEPSQGATRSSSRSSALQGVDSRGQIP